MRHAILCGVVALVGIGCVSPSTRQLAHQNYQAGCAIEDDASLPEGVRQKGTDIAKNSVEVMTDIGTPKNPEAYSPEASARWRKQAQTTRDNRFGFFSGLLSLATSNIPWGGAIGATLLAAFAWWKKNNGAKILESVIEGVEKVKAQMPAAAIDDTNKIMREVANQNGVYVEQKAALTAFREKKS